jgi:hypothetical protein
MCSSSGGQLYEYNFWYNHSEICVYIFNATITDANAGHLDLLLFPKEMRSRSSCYISLNTLNI